MTREEIISGLKFTVEMFLLDPSTGETFPEPRNDMDKITIDACKGAIELLEQEPCEDAINRQKAIDTITALYLDGDSAISFRASAEGDTLIGKYQAITVLDDLPPVIPQPKTGHWIIKDSKEQGYDITGVKTWYIQIMCDKCGFINTAIEGHMGQYKFCPNCGVKMEKSQESEGKR